MMDPFIMRFAVGTSCPSDKIPSLLYDTSSEMMLISGAEKPRLAIDDPNIGVPTGTYITEAKTDPTRDEPMDR
jgi:hypothetical protein